MFICTAVDIATAVPVPGPKIPAGVDRLADAGACGAWQAGEAVTVTVTVIYGTLMKKPAGALEVLFSATIASAV